MGKYKKLYGTLLLGLVAIIILLTAVFSYSRSIEESYKEENINSLKELSNQGALMLHNEIKNKQNLLAELSHDVNRIFVNVRRRPPLIWRKPLSATVLNELA